jgi:hypothetical protein
MTQDTRTAFHEAGHAVAAWRAGARFRRATIVPDTDALGSVKHFPFNRKFDPTLDEYVARRRFEPLILALFAGVLAEKRHTGRRHNWVGASHDMDAVSRLTDYCAGLGNDERRHYFRWMQARAKAIVEFEWPHIEAVANALLLHRTLTEQEVWDTIWASYKSRSAR